MDMIRMRDILAPYFAQIRENLFFTNELGILHGDSRVFQLILQQRPPFVINDHRFGIIVRGEARINVNLVDRHITAGTLVYIGPGSIITPVAFSDDLQIYGMALFADFPLPFASGQTPSAFNGQVRDLQLQVGESDILTARHLIDVLWHVVHQPDYHRPVVSALVAALIHHYDSVCSRYNEQQAFARSREHTIFDRFIQLVNQHCREQHQISYYAQRMCLTERYLSTVVRQASGTTAKDWIDRALVIRIKIELKHTDKTVACIADDMKFPNPSFFCKYFKRLTGVTPQKYRDS